MKKAFSRFLSLFCIFALLMSFSSCTDESKSTQNENVSYHTVTFNSNGGSEIPEVRVAHGSYIQKPSKIPMLENHIFSHWSLDGEQFFFDIKTIEKDITLCAEWISAENMFELVPDENGISISGIKLKKSLESLFVPALINGKSVVAVLDGAFEKASEQHAKNIIFPETVTYIGSHAFSDILSAEITFEGRITELCESSFEECKTLTSISLGEGLQSIPIRAFAKCTSLKSIDIPSGVSVISENAFDGCSSMLTAVLPSTLRSIENSAFLNTNIQTVFFGGTEEEFNSIEIAEKNEKITTATLYFYSKEKPADEGNYWHYNNNNIPILW